MEEKKSDKINIYTDGACKGNPGPGGWGVFIIYKNNKTKELYGYEKNTTNNRMELVAAIKALEFIELKEQIILHTDSTYLKQGITVWIQSWKRNNWKNKQKKDIKNLDLWKKLDTLNNFDIIDWKWVKAHDGNPGNEKADSLANDGIKKLFSIN
tara:strand:+ start:178 stop:639 length:462 start_codon:yes stop_codon:yes gene_type:complete